MSTTEANDFGSWSAVKRLIWFRWCDEMRSFDIGFDKLTYEHRFEAFNNWYARKRLLGQPFTITSEDLLV